MTATNYAITSDLVWTGSELCAGITEGMPVVVRNGKVVRRSDIGGMGMNYHALKVYESCGDFVRPYQIAPTHKVAGIYTSSIGCGVELLLLDLRTNQPLLIGL